MQAQNRRGARGFRSLAAVTAAFTAVMIIAYAVTVHGYGYWRPDTWEYLDNPHDEFEYNQRWLLPPLFHLLRWIPSYAAWLLAMLLFAWFGYSTARRYLEGSPWNSRLVCLTVAGYFVLNPALQDQFTWPNHSFAAILLLVLLDFLRKRWPAVPVVMAGTPLLLGILQSFAFLSLLLLLPGFIEISQSSVKQSFWKVARAIAWWVASFLLGWAIAQLILRVHFGYVPPLSAWRHPVPAASLGELLDNLSRNLGIMLGQLHQYYGSDGVRAAVILLGAAAAYLLIGAPREGRQHAWLALFGLVLYPSIYVITSPVGTILPFRVAFVYGPALAVIAMALMAASRLPVVAMLAASGLSLYPAVLGLANVHWFGGYTRQLRAAVAEIKPDPSTSRGVLLDTQDVISPEDAAGSHPDFLFGFPRVFDPIHSPYAFTPAFYENGFHKVYLCGPAGEVQACAVMKKPVTFGHCATNLKVICGAAVTTEGYWPVRL